MRAQGVELPGGGADEAPECYKRLSDVLVYHGDTIEILHTLRPIGVAMAGREIFDRIGSWRRAPRTPPADGILMA